MTSAPRNLTRRAVALGVLAASALLSACTLLPKSEKLAVYQLPLTALPAASQSPTMSSLRISTPESGQMIDSARILVVPDGNRLAAYEGVRWADPSPVLVRERLVQAFLDDRRIAVVSTDRNPLPSVLDLSGTLRTFQVEYRDSKPVAVVRYEARLVALRTGRLLAANRFEVAQPSNGTSVTDVVTAFGQATDALSAALVKWAVEQGAATAPLDARPMPVSQQNPSRQRHDEQRVEPMPQPAPPKPMR